MNGPLITMIGFCDHTSVKGQ